MCLTVDLAHTFARSFLDAVSHQWHMRSSRLRREGVEDVQGVIPHIAYARGDADNVADAVDLHVVNRI